MNKTTELHEKAMEFYDEAFFARRENNLSLADEKFRKAFELETQAAEMLKDKTDVEPSRSILYRGAASLAIKCSEYRQAEKLIATALSGNPPEEIAEELRDLLKEANIKKKAKNKPKEIERAKLTFADETFEVSGYQIGRDIYLREISKSENKI